MPFTNRRRRFAIKRRKSVRSRFRRRFRRTFRSRRRSRAPNLNRTTIQRWPGGFFTPNQVKCRLRYTGMAVGTFSTTRGVFVLAGNDLVDPDITGTGTQPRGFDQLSALFNRFYVGASKIKLRPVINTTNANVVFALEAVPGVLGATGNIADILERKYVTYGFTQQQSLPRLLRRYGSTAGVFGLSKSAARADIFEDNNEESFSGQTVSHAGGEASPQRLWSWQCYFQNADQTTSTTCNIWFEVDYYCLFWDRVTPPIS